MSWERCQNQSDFKLQSFNRPYRNRKFQPYNRNSSYHFRHQSYQNAGGCLKSFPSSCNGNSGNVKYYQAQPMPPDSRNHTFLRFRDQQPGHRDFHHSPYSMHNSSKHRNHLLSPSSRYPSGKLNSSCGIRRERKMHEMHPNDSIHESDGSSHCLLQMQTSSANTSVCSDMSSNDQQNGDIFSSPLTKLDAESQFGYDNCDSYQTKIYLYDDEDSMTNYKSFVETPSLAKNAEELASNDVENICNQTKSKCNRSEKIGYPVTNLSISSDTSSPSDESGSVSSIKENLIDKCDSCSPVPKIETEICKNLIHSKRIEMPVLLNTNDLKAVCRDVGRNGFFNNDSDITHETCDINKSKNKNSARLVDSDTHEIDKKQDDKSLISKQIPSPVNEVDLNFMDISSDKGESCLKSTPVSKVSADKRISRVRLSNDLSSINKNKCSLRKQISITNSIVKRKAIIKKTISSPLHKSTVCKKSIQHTTRTESSKNIKSPFKGLKSGSFYKNSKSNLSKLNQKSSGEEKKEHASGKSKPAKTKPNGDISSSQNSNGSPKKSVKTDAKSKVNKKSDFTGSSTSQPNSVSRKSKDNISVNMVKKMKNRPVTSKQSQNILLKNKALSTKNSSVLKPIKSQPHKSMSKVGLNKPSKVKSNTAKEVLKKFQKVKISQSTKNINTPNMKLLKNLPIKNSSKKIIQHTSQSVALKVTTKKSNPSASISTKSSVSKVTTKKLNPPVTYENTAKKSSGPSLSNVQASNEKISKLQKNVKSATTKNSDSKTSLMTKNINSSSKISTPRAKKTIVPVPVNILTQPSNPNKKKKRKFFKGTTYQLTVNGVLRKKRRVDSAASSPRSCASVASTVSSHSSEVTTSVNTNSPSTQTEDINVLNPVLSCDVQTPQVARKSINKISDLEKEKLNRNDSAPVSNWLQGAVKENANTTCLSSNATHANGSTLFNGNCAMVASKSVFSRKLPTFATKGSGGKAVATNHITPPAKKVCRKPAEVSIPKETVWNLRPSENFFKNELLSGDLNQVINVLANGANPNYRFKNHEHNTPLHIVASLGYLEVVKLLIQSDVHIDSVNDSLRTPLMQAIEKCHLAVVQYLLTSGAEAGNTDMAGMTPFHLAARAGNLEVAKLVYETGAVDIDCQDDGGWTALVWACEFSHHEVAEWLLNKGADPDIRDKEMNVALHWACFSGSAECLSSIIDKGSNVNAINKRKDSALHIASRKEHFECVRLLLSRGALTNIRNQDNLLPSMCCQNFECETFKCLQGYEIAGSPILSSMGCSDVTRGKELHPIEVVNNFDNEEFVFDFCYTTNLCESPNIHINKLVKSINACRCSGVCSKTRCTCSALSVRLWYDKERRLLPHFNMSNPPVIFECSKMCRCSQHCLNRVVQHGIRCHFQLFRTRGKGWGVKPLHDIDRGVFVCEYLGELLTDAEAEKREDDSYLLDLESDALGTYCVDAKFYGNISRFINHSCEPNLTAVKVFIEHQDLNFPRIALFSNRPIKAYEELSFDYGERFWQIKSNYFLCMCGTKSCKYSRDTINNSFIKHRSKLKAKSAKAKKV